MPINVINSTTINVIRLNHKCKKLAMTSKSRGYKLVILFVHFLRDSCIKETKTEKAIIMVCEQTDSVKHHFIRNTPVLIFQTFPYIYPDFQTCVLRFRVPMLSCQRFSVSSRVVGWGRGRGLDVPYCSQNNRER